jgi:hypothetical protein
LCWMRHELFMCGNQTQPKSGLHEIYVLLCFIACVACILWFSFEWNENEAHAWFYPFPLGIFDSYEKRIRMFTRQHIRDKEEDGVKAHVYNLASVGDRALCPFQPPLTDTAAPPS